MKTNLEVVYTDLLYFGYDYETKEAAESKKHQTEFIDEIKQKFPNVEFRDCYDSIKGYRQEVYLEKKNENNYFSWLFGKGWFNFSMTMQVLMRSTKEPDQKEKFDRYSNLAKKQYPEAFKLGTI